MRKDKLLLAVPLLLLAYKGYAQASSPSQLDKLREASQVQQFVRAQAGAYSNYKDYKDFVLTDSLDQECRSELVCATPNDRRSWLKADFDGNGLADLVVTGYPSSSSLRRRITCFLDQGNQKMQEIRLAPRVYDCAVLQLVQLKDKAAIRYTHILEDRRYYEKRPSPVCQIDTLIFDKTQFVEYNHALRDYGIQKVSFSTTPCYGTCPVFNLHIDQSGAAIYEAIEYNKKIGKFTATIAATQLQELWMLLNYLNFPKLNDHYSIGATDHPTSKLTIMYAGGQVKTIEDYGEQGTFGLSRAYELLFALRTTQPWR